MKRIPLMFLWLTLENWVLLIVNTCNISETEEGDAWKHISATLDAGSKIYGFRVDLVH